MFVFNMSTARVYSIDIQDRGIEIYSDDTDIFFMAQLPINFS